MVGGLIAFVTACVWDCKVGSSGKTVYFRTFPDGVRKYAAAAAFFGDFIRVNDFSKVD